MPRYIIDTDKMAEYTRKVTPSNRGALLREIFINLHNGIGNYDFATRIKKETKPKGGYTGEFEEFWDCYPKKVGKGAAFKSWTQCKEDKQDLLVLCVKAISWQKRTDQWSKDEGMYIPHPSTYINQRRWEDECPPELKGNAPAKRTYRDMDGILRED